MQSAEQLEASGIATRVVSMPCWTVFAGEDADYRESVLPSKITARVAVEAASPLGWERWVGSTGAIIGMSTFGASAPATELYRHFGLTTDNIVAAAKAQLKRSSL